jgi:hypothetical protein
MPTAATTTYTALRVDPVYESEDAPLHNVALAASTVYAAGTVLGEVTATPGTFKPYASGNGDGSQVAKAILQYACATDGSGNITLGGAATGGPWGETRLTAPAYFAGIFRCADLTGLDANAVTNLSGHLINGSITTGIVRIG